MNIRIQDERLFRIRDLADSMGVRIFCADRQLGISGGLLALASIVKNKDDNILFLEEDWRLVTTDMKHTESSIREASEMLSRGEAHVVKLRHRTSPGIPNCASVWKDKTHLMTRLLSPHTNGNRSICSSVYWIQDPSQVFPGLVWRCGNTSHCSRSRHCSWTNNPHLVSLSWWLGNIGPVARADMSHMDNNRNDWEKGRLEPAMNHAPFLWDDMEYVIAHQGTGLFEHADIDRPVSQQSSCGSFDFVLVDGA